MKNHKIYEEVSELEDERITQGREANWTKKVTMTLIIGISMVGIAGISIAIWRLLEGD